MKRNLSLATALAYCACYRDKRGRNTIWHRSCKDEMMSIIKACSKAEGVRETQAKGGQRGMFSRW